MMNYETVGNADLLNNYCFNVGDIVVDVDKNSSEFYESNMNDINNSQRFFEEENVVNNEQFFNDASVVEVTNECNENNCFNNSVLEIDHPACLSQETMHPLQGGELQVDNFQSSVSEINSIEDSRVFEEVHSVIDNSVADNTQIFTDNSRVNNSAKNPVTVNFNAYNEFHSVAADTDSIMAVFGEKLAQAVSLAAEGLHL
jgi:hypothetical protein